LREVKRELEEEYRVTDRPMPFSDRDLSLYRHERDGIKVESDSLSAFLYQFKAVLFQREAAAFTSRDLSLRNTVLEAYPRESSGLLSTTFIGEPGFTVE
ncbi:hypothetical protein JXL21_02905, partial [Candidatus Bathyarchaeota archaeon]|nr:hypothetical protein [Candidatus Bathyarchaeota archaeon]